jgi:carbonic anhydrase
VEISVERLKELQPILEPRVKDGKLKVVGAIYDVRTGAVTLVERGRS